jgi:hypothetical protein
LHAPQPRTTQALSFPLVDLGQQGLVFPTLRRDLGERRFHALANAPKMETGFCKRIGCGEIWEPRAAVMDELKKR